MTPKERIHLIVEELDDRQAAAALDMLAGWMIEPMRLSDEEPVSAPGHAVTPESPLWTIVGLIDDDGPTDVSERVADYVAEASAESHEGTT